jgi:hypothetical protein
MTFVQKTRTSLEFKLSHLQSSAGSHWRMPAYQICAKLRCSSATTSAAILSLFTCSVCCTNIQCFLPKEFCTASSNVSSYSVALPPSKSNRQRVMIVFKPRSTQLLCLCKSLGRRSHVSVDLCGMCGCVLLGFERMVFILICCLYSGISILTGMVVWRR